MVKTRNFQCGRLHGECVYEKKILNIFAYAHSLASHRILTQKQDELKCWSPNEVKVSFWIRIYGKLA